jgi:hypothetical protein
MKMAEFKPGRHIPVAHMLGARYPMPSVHLTIVVVAYSPALATE